MELILGLSVFSVYNYYREDKADWRGITQYLATQASPDDAVLFYAGYTKLGYDYYLKHLPPGSTPEVVFPIDGVHDPDGPPPEELVGKLSSRYGRAWLILSHDQLSNLGKDTISADIQATLAASYDEMEEQEFTGIRVLRYRQEEIAAPSLTLP